MRNAKKKYTPPTNMNTNSEKAAHFLHWCYKNRPGERIKHREVARIVHGVQDIRASHIRSVKSMTAHVARRIWKDHELGLDTNEGGFKVVDDVGEYVRTDYMKRYGRFAAGKRSIEFGNQIVDSKRHGFKDTPEGRGLKRFYEKVRKASSAAELPSAAEARGLLGATVEREE